MSSTDYQIVAKICEELPEVWRVSYPRRYENLGKWCSPKIASVALAHPVVTLQVLGENFNAMPMAAVNQFLVAAKCVEHDVPTYFVPNALLHAIDNTTPDGSIDWTQLKLPHDGAVFVFERGAICHPNAAIGEIPFAAYARTHSGERLRHPCIRDAITVQGGGFVVMTMAHESDKAYTFDLCMSEHTSQRLCDVVNTEKHHDRALTPSEWDPCAVVMSPDETKFNTWLTTLVLKLLLFMLARPNDVQHGSIARVVKQRRTGSPIEFWHPNVMGRNYVTAREMSAGTHASPRLHWRRGHFRNQRHGPGFSLVKTIWIEPVLVAPSENKQPATT